MKSRGLKRQLQKNSKVFLFLFPVLAAIVLFCIYQIVTIQVEITRKNEEIAGIADKRIELEAENQLLSRYNTDEYRIEYIESIARDKLGYALPEERIYYIVPAD